MLNLGREDVLRLLSYEECVAWVEEGMRDEGNGKAEGLPRFRLDIREGAGEGLSNAIALFCAGAPGKGFAAVRSMGGRPFRAGLVLYDNAGEAVAVMDFAHLQIYRTGSAGAVGAKYLSRPDSHRLAVIGSGRMAKASLAAHAVVRELTDVRVYSRRVENREAFAKEMTSRIGVGVEPSSSMEAAVRDADIIIVCANVQRLDEEPAFRGALLRPGVFVSANGGPADLDQETFARATRIIVDDKPEVRNEMRDIGKAVEDGRFTWDDIDSLSEVVAGKRPGRQSAEDIIVLRNRGSAVQDLYPAANLYLKARQAGIGIDSGDVMPPRIGF